MNTAAPVERTRNAMFSTSGQVKAACWRSMMTKSHPTAANRWLTE
jgi:hypothetical protein